MITDDDLLLYHYRELDESERTRIGAALAEQPELARRLQALVARLDAAAAMPEVPVPPATMLRWQVALDEAARSQKVGDTAEVRELPRARWSFPTWGWQAAAAGFALVALALVVNQVREPPAPPIAGNDPAIAEPATTSVSSGYANGLRYHLANTERQLVDLREATPEERAALVDAIIEQNRLYALAAERAGEPQLARVLRAFTPVLENVAAGREEATAGSIAQLGFELRVMQSRLAAETTTRVSDDSTTL